MFTAMPELSIITINLNNAAGLRKTFDSVFEQTFTDFEYIVIDGASADGSKEIMEAYANKLSYWVSEKDSGIYNAMNKGIAKARGEYILFLNSADCLVHNKALHDVFSEGISADIIYGNLMTDSGMISYPGTLTFAFFFTDSIGHPAAFIKKSLFDRFGNYNEENKLVSDWEFFLKTIIEHKVSYRHINKAITYFDSKGITTKEESISINLQERIWVLEPLFSNYYPELLHEFNELHNELNLYKNSRAMKFIKKIMDSKLYRIFPK